MPTETSDFHITLVRHGQSNGNAGLIIQGRHDYPLSKLGKSQAQALANRWRSENRTFDYVIASPLIRAKETAEIVCNILKLEPEFDPIWMERDYGKLSGLTLPDVDSRQLWPDYKKIYRPVGEDGESVMALYFRAGKALESVLSQEPGRYLIFSHGGILNMVLYTAIGIVPGQYVHGVRFTFQNTAFATLLYLPEEGNLQILGINDYHHLHNNNQV